MAGNFELQKFEKGSAEPLSMEVIHAAEARCQLGLQVSAERMGLAVGDGSLLPSGFDAVSYEPGRAGHPYAGMPTRG